MKDLQKRRGLTETELSAIAQLADICNIHDTLEMRLLWNVLRSRSQERTSDFLYYIDGQLVGFLGLYSFNSQEGEISGMVHPEHRRKGIFTALLNAAKEECQQRELLRLLLIVEHTSASGQAFAHAVDAHYDHSEYKMELEEPRLPATYNEHLHFRPTTPEDAQVMTHITSISFDMPEEEVSWYTDNVLNDPTRRYYIAALDNVYIGKIDVILSDANALIVGFGVLPAYRGRGYGRQILARTIQAVLADGPKHIELEVTVENKNALSLYQSCGFREVRSYDYHRLSI